MFSQSLQVGGRAGVRAWVGGCACMDGGRAMGMGGAVATTVGSSGLVSTRMGIYAVLCGCGPAVQLGTEEWHIPGGGGQLKSDQTLLFDQLVRCRRHGCALHCEVTLPRSKRSPVPGRNPRCRFKEQTIHLWV